MVSIIAAMTPSGVIGKNNTLPWHLPEDLKLFKANTMGGSVVMGRNTFDSLKMPNGLPNRHNIVISTQAPNFATPNVTWANRLDVAIEVGKGYSDNVFIIGGANVYAQVLEQDCVDAMLISMVDEEYEGDVKFPNVDWAKWEMIESVQHTGFIFKKLLKRKNI